MMTRWRRSAWPGLVLVALVSVSCGGGDSESSQPVEAPASTAAAETTAPATSATTSEAAAVVETTQAASQTTAAAEPLGPPAPDFTLQLAAGGDFVLSQQTQPVVVFFWAEW